MEVILAKKAGFCFGVQKAVDKALNQETNYRGVLSDKLVVYSAMVKAGVRYMNFFKSVLARKMMYERSVYAKCISVLKKATVKQESAEDMNFNFGSIDILNEFVFEDLFE